MPLSRQAIHRVTAIAPLVMSGMALLLVLIALASGWERHRTDEGAAAHIFQLLMAAQAPPIVIFLATADWRRPMPVFRILGFQFLALAVALGTVAISKL